MSDTGFMEAMYDEIYGLNCTIGQLTVENAKLRELVCDMFRKVRRAAFDGSTGWAEVREITARMRELDVEVDA